MKRIGLVTGVGGFIGSSIARALLQQGWTVRGVDNFLTGSEDDVPPGVDLVRGDLRDLETAKSVCKGVETVWHQAAVRNVARSIEEPLLTESCNVNATINLLLGADEAAVRRVIYASSSSVYGDVAGSANFEDQPLDPRSPYAVSKLSAEQYCRVWTRVKGLSTVSLRYVNVFGPGQNPDSKYSAVFPGFISALTEDRAPEVHWDGEQSRDFTYIDDVVRANLMAGDAGPEADGTVMNIAGGGSKSVNDVLRAVSEKVGKWIEPDHLPMRAGDVRRSRADISRAESLLGWKPQAQWDEAVAETVQWFTDHKASTLARASEGGR